MIVRRLGMAVLTVLLISIGRTQSALANAFEPPPESNAPRSTAGGGSRPAESSCTLDQASGLRATVLAPQSFVGLTEQVTPNLWLYRPSNEAETIEISVFDQQLNGLTQLEISPPDSAGFLSIDLSEHITLSAGVPYYWTAAFVCNPNRRTEDWVVGSWIQHQPMSTDDQQALQALAPIDQVNQYISTGYWYDAFTVMLPLVQSNPSSSSLEASWDTLIQQANLTLTWVELDNVIRISKP